MGGASRLDRFAELLAEGKATAVAAREMGCRDPAPAGRRMLAQLRKALGWQAQ